MNLKCLFVVLPALAASALVSAQDTDLAVTAGKLESEELIRFADGDGS